MEPCSNDAQTGIRGRLSSRLAQAIMRRTQSSAARGSTWSLRPKTWQLLPAAAQKWLAYRVLAPLEEAARKTIERHEVLGPIAKASENNPWAITPAAMLYLWDLLERMQPTSIIELGSGQSTRLFAAYAQRMAAQGRPVSLLSIEHDERWLEQTRTAIERAGQLDFVRFQFAPITGQKLLGRSMPAYSLNAAVLDDVAGERGFDLCFIDGPTGALGRAGGLALVASHLAKNACVLVDDALRPGEQAAFVEWQAAFGRRMGIPRIHMIDRHGLLHFRWNDLRAAAREQHSHVAGRSRAAHRAMEPRDDASPKFVAVASNAWDGQWMNRQHLMWAMKERAPVIYVQEPEPWYSSRKPRDERFFRPALEQKDPRLSVLRLPKALCSRGREGKWNRAANRLKARSIDSALPRSAGPRVFYFWHPELYRYIDLLKPALTVYHMFDRAPEYHDPAYADTPAYDAFHRACALADIVICGTRQQAEVVQGAKPVIIPNGVAANWYEGNLPEPYDLAGIPHPRIGYAGQISKKLDFSWFEKIAEQPGWQLVLVGPLGNLDGDAAAAFARLRARDNVHYLGAKGAMALPAYLKSFDVGLLNYRRGVHSEAASPLKLYEYAAAGLPMVGSPMAATAGDPQFAGLIEFVDSPGDAVEAIARALAVGADGESVERRLDFARQNSWARRADQILQLIQAKLRGLAEPAALRGPAPTSEMIMQVNGNAASRALAIRST